MRHHRPKESGKPGQAADAIPALLQRGAAAVKMLGLLLISALIAACGSGGGAGVSSEAVSGVAATGAPLVGQVTLRDSSAARKDKVSVIANDGSYSIDVSDMQAPFLLKASGSSDGGRHTLYSFAGKPGTANINPLSSAAVASAAGVDDPAEAFDKPDPVTMDKLRYGMHGSVNTLKSKLRILLEGFDADDVDPVTDPFRADHTGLDGMFDNVNIVLAKGTLTITNATTGAVLFTARVSDVASGRFTDNHDDLPKPGPRPAAPTGVSASGGEGQVTIAWDAVEDATSYRLYYSTRSRSAEQTEDEEAEAKQIKNVTSPYVLTGLAPDTTYYFTLRALIGNRRGPSSAEASATTSAAAPAPTIPAAPADVAATGGTRQTTITWSEVGGASAYNLYWSTSAGVTAANGTRIGGVTSPAVHTGLSDNTSYYYIVTAENSAGEGAASVQVAATTLDGAPAASAPDAPTAVSAAGGDAQVTLSWPAVAGADSYNIYWSTAPGVSTSTGTRIAAVTSPYVHGGLAAGTGYFYIVTAANSAGESSPSLEVGASTDAPAAAIPAAPADLAASGGAKQVTLSWTAVSGASSYNLYWSTSAGVSTATGTKIAAVSSPHVHTGLADGSAYFYVLTAVNASGESAASSEATASTDAAAIDGAALYTQYCASCHGPLGSSDKQGATAAQISSGIANVPSMFTRFNAGTGTQIKLTAEQIAALSAALQ
jgi:fibronectin type 3 domain-containing protein